MKDAVKSMNSRVLVSPRFPFDPARLPFFYGWVVIVLSTLGVLASIPGQTMGISVFTDSVLGATGLSRLAFSNAYLVGTVGSGLLLPWAGQWIDRYGVRLIVLGACLTLGATLWLLTVADRVIDHLAAGPAHPGVVSTAVAGPLFFAVAFFLLRFSGQGLLTLTSRTMLGRWYDRRRGLVAASSGALVSFGFSLAPVLLLAWIGASGWRGAWREMGLVLGAFGVLAALLFRDRPEEIGQVVDGGPVSRSEVETSSDLEASGFDVEGWDLGGGGEIVEVASPWEATRGQAARTVEFWLLTGTVAIQALVGTALTFHIVDIGVEHGLVASRAVGVFVPISLVSVLFGFLVGYLLDRVRVVRLLQLMLLGELVAFFAATHFGEEPWRWIMIVAWGIAGGCYGPLTVAALPKLFGRQSLGSISGLMTMFLVIASALGPAAFAFSKATSGSYSPALLASCAMPLAALLWSPRIKR